jgi:DNA-binding beta-propeller fold protein YncE
LIGLASFGSGLAQQAAKPERFFLVGDFALGPAVDRADYESIDTTTQRLYIANMGGGQLLVFDIAHDRLIAQMHGFPKITGVLAAPEVHKIYASVPGSGLVASLIVGLGMLGLSSGQGAVAVLDARSLKEVARVPGGIFPDGIAYDPEDQRVFVSDEFGGAVTVIDAGADKFETELGSGVRRATSALIRSAGPYTCRTNRTTT